MNEADRSGDMWQDYFDKREPTIDDNINVEVLDSQDETSFTR
jgi:hypothetical protein